MPYQGYQSTAQPGGGVHSTWNGYKIIEALNQAVLLAAQRGQQRAVRYWEEEWTPARHPYMTGNQHSIYANGYWRVMPVDRGHVHLIGGSTSEHTMYEEFGTARQPAHAPIRHTFDRLKYTLSQDLAWATRQVGFTRGRPNP